MLGFAAHTGLNTSHDDERVTQPAQTTLCHRRALVRFSRLLAPSRFEPGGHPKRRQIVRRGAAPQDAVVQRAERNQE